MITSVHAYMIMLFQTILVLLCILAFASARDISPAYHEESLKAIARTLGKADWDASGLDISHSATPNFNPNPPKNIDNTSTGKDGVVRSTRLLSDLYFPSPLYPLNPRPFILSPPAPPSTSGWGISSSASPRPFILSPLAPPSTLGRDISLIASPPAPSPTSSRDVSSDTNPSPANPPIPSPLTPSTFVSSSKRSEKGNGMSAGAKIGIIHAIVAVVFIMLLVAGILWWRGCMRRKTTTAHDIEGVDHHITLFSLRQIKAATNKFDPANKIGEGGFGTVYKGCLLDGSIIAVKQLSSRSRQGNREFVTEIGMISTLRHPHLVKLYGYCNEGDQLLLVYEYMENNSLAQALLGPEEHRLHLDWPTRHKICIGIAKALTFLHEESKLKIVHRDIKAANVLLDKNNVAKISDFGLARLNEEDRAHITTRLAGTYGYMSPEYAMGGYLTNKVDVFAFGVVLLEIVSGKSIAIPGQKATSFYLLEWANSLKEKENLLELVDPILESNYNKKEVTTVINVALLCTNTEAAERPNMSTAVSILEGKAHAPEFDSVYKMTAAKDMPVHNNGNGQIVHVTPGTTASSSSTDLFPISLNSDFLAKRDP